MASMATAQSAAATARALAARSVHLKIHPRPRNLAESRELLRVMQSYGEVEMFRHLKYEQVPARNTAIVIFKSAESAEQAMRASPVRFMYGDASGSKLVVGQDSHSPLASTPSAVQSHESDTDPNITPTHLPSDPDEPPITLRYPPMTIKPRRQVRYEPSTNSPHPPPPPEPQFEEATAGPRPCTVDINASRHGHKEHIQRQWYYAGFRTDVSVRPGAGVLGPLPRGMEGLANWKIDMGERRSGRYLNKTGKMAEYADVD